MLRASLAGKLRNTTLPKSSALLPVFEAVYNSFQAIDDAPQSPAHEINVHVQRQNTLSPSGSDPVSAFIIADTGVGFTQANYNSFVTADSLHKQERGGKGVGRFLWLKAFAHADIDSHFLDQKSGELRRRVFHFDLTFDKSQDGDTTPSNQTRPRTTISLVDYLDPYRSECPRDLTIIAQRFVGHFLPLFLAPDGPAFILEDDYEAIDLRVFFREHVEELAILHPFQVGEHNFSLRGFRLQGGYHSDHQIVYAAHYREVISERLARHIPNLKNKLSDPKRGLFTYIGLVQSRYLDESVNSERTDFSFPKESPSDDDLLANELNLKAIRDEALSVVRSDLTAYLDELNAGKAERLQKFVNEEAPEYRILLRDMPTFIDDVPLAASDADLDATLHRQLYRRQLALRDEGREILSQVVNAEDIEEYDERLQHYIKNENEIGKTALAKYVTHRRVILDLLDKAVSLDEAGGKYPLERAVHRLVFPMRTFSDEIPTDQQNLWVIDERLAYHAFLSSDQTLTSVPVLNTPSQSRPDILIFNRPLLFGDDSQPLTSMIVIEFKRADRDDYRDETPVEQVFRMVREVRDGTRKDLKGRPIRPSNRDIPAYCYVICDLTPKLETYLENMSAIRTPDNLGYFGYNTNLTAYYEVISYNKLLADAKKRNRILFEKLNLAATT